MLKLKRLEILFVFAFLSICTCNAAPHISSPSSQRLTTDGWQKHSLNGMKAFSKGQYLEAEKEFKAAIEELEQKPAHKADLAKQLGKLGDVYRRIGRHKDSEPIYQRSLSMTEEIYGKNSVEAAIAMDNLAASYRNLKKYDEACVLIRKALPVFEKQYGPDSDDVKVCLSNLALVYEKQNKLPEAEDVYKRILASDEKSNRITAEYAMTLDNLASLYVHQKKFAEAETYSQNAASIFEKTLGPNHPELALCLLNQAVASFAQHKYDNCPTPLLRSIAIFEKSAPNSPVLAHCYRTLSEVYSKMGKTKESSEMATKASKIAPN
jgi:tetratricopeptide (TPR) repeat protein